MGHCCSKYCPHYGYNDNEDDEQELNVDLASENVHLVTSMETWEARMSEAMKDNKIVVANFSASWCFPCKKIAPFYGELADKYPCLMCLVVDVEELPEFSTSWGIKATPTFFFLRDGRQVDKLIGANKVELEAKIASIVDLAEEPHI